MRSPEYAVLYEFVVNSRSVKGAIAFHHSMEKAHYCRCGRNAKPDEVCQSTSAADEHLIRDPANQTVDQKKAGAMMLVDRYDNRSRDLGEFISATHDHFWDPNDES